MHLRIALLATALVPVARDAAADFPLCGLLHHRHTHACCDPCQVHVHLCNPAEAGHHQPSADLPASSPPAISPQLMYAPLLPSTVGYTMPMMSPMPMMMPYPVQQAMMGLQMQPQQQQQQMQTPAAQAPRDAACGGCEDRVARLESGVKHLSERMDRIELILENQVIAMEGIRDALKQGNLQEPSQR